MFSETALCSCLVVTFPAWTLLYFLYRFLMFSENISFLLVLLAGVELSYFFKLPGGHILCRGIFFLHVLTPSAKHVSFITDGDELVKEQLLVK